MPKDKIVWPYISSEQRAERYKSPERLPEHNNILSILRNIITQAFTQYSLSRKTRIPNPTLQHARFQAFHRQRYPPRSRCLQVRCWPARFMHLR